MMKVLIVLVGLVVCVGLVCVGGCSQENREEAIERVKNAADALNGDDKKAEKEHGTPLIVQEQQKAERIRQNMQWTSENQKRYPMEYCQAKLVELDKMSTALEVTAHTVATQQARVQRCVAEEAVQLKNLEAFLATAKDAYRKAEAEDKWPVVIGGFKFSREKAQEKMLDAYNRLKDIKAGQDGYQNQLAKLEKKLETVRSEQRKLEKAKESVRSAIDSIRVNQAVEGENGIASALDALQDSINALERGSDDPSLEELVTPTPASTRDEDFKALMNE